MGTNFYLSKKHSEDYVLPRLMQWMADKTNELRFQKKDQSAEQMLHTLLHWFDEFVNTCNEKDYLVYVSQFKALLHQGYGRVQYNSVQMALDQLELQYNRTKEEDYINFRKKILNAIESGREICVDDFMPVKELILQDTIFDGDDGAHIGKRSAAGDFCFKCNMTMCTGGKEGVHHSEYGFYKTCPECGSKPEYTYSFCFQWSKDFWKALFSEVNELDIYDEYDEHFTKSQFFEGELDHAAKACPDNIWDYQLFYEEERRFS